MKRFAFTLARILDYKNQILRNEKARLAGLNAELGRMQREKEEMMGLIDKANVDGRGVAGQSISAAGLLANRNYIEGLRTDVLLVNAQINAQQNLMERQLREVVAIQKDIAAMETLRDKQRKEYDFKVNKEEELFIEDFVSGRSRRAQLAEEALEKR